MSWVVILWSMMAAASLTLAAIHLLVWHRRHSEYEHLLFFTLAASAAAFGGCELALMRAQTPAAYAETLRWAQLPLSAFVVSVVGFVHFYFGTGRAWLGYAVCALRVATLVLNFTTGANVNFTSVLALDPLALWGARIAAPVGESSRWVWVPQLSNVLLVIYIVDAAVALWRHGDAPSRRRAAVVGGALVLCVGIAATIAALTLSGAVHAPTMVLPSVFILVLAMGYELGRDLLAAAHLASRLRASEERFRTVVQAVPNAILLVDESGKMTFANAQVRRVFGYEPEEIVGRGIDSLVPSGVAVAHEQYRSAYTRHAQARAMGAGRELFGRRKDGTDVPVEVGLNPLSTPEGMLVLVSVVDVSERRRMEHEAMRQRSELAHLSRVGMLGALSGSLAHELNQPLAAILSNAQAAQRFLAQQPPRLDQVSDIIADIVRSDRRAAAVIQRLRAMIRKEDVEHRPLDVNEVAQDSLRLMHSDLLGRRIDATFDLARGLPPISGDRVQLQQVMLNFVMNAADAMEHSTGERTITVRTSLTPGGYVEIAVSDRGPGIALPDLETIFEPFVTSKRHGIGLGLAICRTIADAHGGRIFATNNADGGATLHFEIPGTA